jgi:hypothetical protein
VKYAALLFLLLLSCDGQAYNVPGPQTECIRLAAGECVTKFRDGKVTCYTIGWRSPSISCVVGEP